MVLLAKFQLYAPFPTGVDDVITIQYGVADESVIPDAEKVCTPSVEGFGPVKDPRLTLGNLPL